MNLSILCARSLATVCLCFGVSLLAADFVPLPRAHSHNDYEQPRPLLAALDQGFCSVEADIHLVDGELLVAHDAHEVKPERTLKKLYLDPLMARVKKNDGRVYRNGPEFTLLIDFKTDATSTYKALAAELEQYAEMLTSFESGKVSRKAITVIISGNRPIDAVKAETRRLAALDGRLPDLNQSSASADLFPLISDNWQKTFSWRGEGDMPVSERALLHELVKKAHSQGRKIRFWANPDAPEAWREFHAAGVDLINTHRLSEIRSVLQELGNEATSR